MADKTASLKRTIDAAEHATLLTVEDGALATGSQTTPIDMGDSNMLADLYMNVTAVDADTELTIQLGYASDPALPDTVDTWVSVQKLIFDGTVWGVNQYTLPIYNSFAHTPPRVYRWMQLDCAGVGGSITMDAHLAKRAP